MKIIYSLSSGRIVLNHLLNLIITIKNKFLILHKILTYPIENLGLKEKNIVRVCKIVYH